jgi:hypothetical protein
VPRHLARTVARCLAPDPADRPQRCADILALLDAPPTLPSSASPAPAPGAGAGAGSPDALRDAVREAGAALGTALRTAVDTVIARVPAPVLGVAALGASLSTVFGLALLVTIAYVSRTDADPDVAELPPCPTHAGLLGHALGPWVFDKPEGSVWLIREPTPVGPMPDPGAELVPACMLAPGAQVRVTGTAFARPEGTWVPIHGDRLAYGSPTAVVDEGDGVVGPRCTGEPGQRIGWIFTRPEGISVPKQGGRWNLSFPRAVVSDYPRPENDNRSGPVVCALRKGAWIDMVEEPVKARTRQWWVPVTAGSITEP